MKKLSYINILLSGAVAITVIALYYAQAGFIEGFENRTYDLRFKLRGTIPPDKNIAIIAIDEKSIGELGRYPWTRQHYAELIDKVSGAGAKVLLFDAFFSERVSKKADVAFADSILRSGIVVLPVVVEFSETGEAVNIIENIPELQSAAAAISHINMAPDEDGVVRMTPLLISGPERVYPSLSLVGAMMAMGTELPDVAPYEIRLGRRVIPVDASQRMLINYVGGKGTYERFSFSDVMKGRVSKEKLKDRILLLGATAIGIYDLRVTPFSNNMPGVEVNATIVDNILKGNFIKRGGVETLSDMLFIAGLIAVVSFATLKLRALIAFPFTLILIAGYAIFSYQMFLRGHWLSMVYPIFGIVLCFSATASLRFFIVERRATKVRAMFSSYVSKKIVDELIKSPEKAKVGGEKRTITILFTDVKGYTAFSETHDPEEVVKVLNEFLAEMTDVIMKYDGTLDKFLGDGILAFWGAPVEQNDHPELAVRCSLEMLERMKLLQKKWESEGREALESGMGLNTGEVIIGNIGVEGKKVDYTAIGDNVNLTHRLQDISRTAKKPVISEALYERVKELVDAEYLGEELVKGRNVPIKVYALNSIRGA